jgi:hypothetical protein
MGEEGGYVMPLYGQRRAIITGDLGKLNQYERVLPNLREQLIDQLSAASQMQYMTTFERCLATQRPFRIQQRGGAATMDITVTTKGLIRRTYDYTMRASIELPTIDTTVDMA